MNRRTSKTPATEAGPASPAKTNLTTWAFWGTLLFLAVATVGVALIGNMRAGVTGQTNEVEIDLTTLERALGASSKEASRAVASEIDPLLSDAYDRVYAAIPEYVDFHYSVWGEYSELAETAQGRVGAHLQERLFDGLDQRIHERLEILDEKYDDAYKSTLDAKIQAAIAAETPHGVLSDGTKLVLNAAVARAGIDFPVAGTAAVFGSGGVKALTAVIAAKLTAKTAAKAAAKGGLKVGGVLAGVGSGAALCAPAGPLAFACGVVGGIGTWFLADAAIVNLDEFFNRDEFEADLRGFVDQHKAVYKRRILRAYALNGQKYDKAIAEDFRLSDLPKAGSEN